MESTDDMMKVEIWLFLKILSGVQLLTCNVIFHIEYVRNKFGLKFMD